jgi:nitroreductase
MRAFFYNFKQKMLKNLIKQNRSYRRFYQKEKIETTLLYNWIDLARLSASAKNMQALKYFVSNKEEINSKIFETLAWAGYLKEWKGPVEGERPAAYIVISLDKNITENNYCDHGIATQSILLGAVESGYGGCIIAAINKNKLAKIINLPNKHEILLVLALGKPKETVELYEIDNNEDIKYWRTKEMIHKVPKRKLKDIIINYSK